MKLEIALLLLICVSRVNSATYFSVENYRGRNDSPFINLLEDENVFVEDFESRKFDTFPYNYLVTPYAQAWNGAWAGSTSWGVQEDYSPEDSDGGIGWVWTASGSSSSTTKPPTGIHFDFTPDEQGRLPEYVGAALLGRYDPDSTGQLYNSIFVYDKDGNEVTDGEWKFLRPPFSEIPADPADYFLNFYGIHVAGGISSIQFLGFDEVDHLTYGYSAIPESGVMGLMATASCLLFGRKRRLPVSSIAF